MAGLVQFADGSPEWMIFVRLAYGPLSMASLFWWSLRSLDDKPLLEDYRLTTATPPKVWLAGEPA